MEILEPMSSCGHTQVEDYQLRGPNVHRHVRAPVQVDEAPGRSLPAAIPRSSPHFLSRMAVEGRASVDEAGVLFALVVLHA